MSGRHPDNWTTIPAQDNTPSYASLGIPLQRSEHDDRDYRLIRLENGLQAVLVHDTLADKAAACLEVATGYLQDPLDMPGLAHFCEHMVLKGSEPYPAENDFESFITSNGGFSNASTGPAYTDYWFSIGTDLLTSALPRLAAFFHSPLFAPSVTAREINAVDSEDKKNLQSDGHRISQLSQSLCVPGHPWTKFGTGNIDSLMEAARKLESEGRLPSNEERDGDGGAVGRETRRRLIEWWGQEYCAGRMTLAILGKEPLEELTNLAVKLFSPIPNLGLDPRPAINELPWGNSEMGTIVFVKTVKEFYSFSLTFPLPYQQPHFRTKPTRFISHLLGHEGPGSIYAFLKKQGWVVSLGAGSETWNRGAQMYTISGTLTEAGFSHYQDILMTIYDYISLLRDSPFAPFLHEEVQKLAEIDFRFQEKIQPHIYVSQLTSQLARPYPPEWILSGANLVREWDEKLVRETLDGFVPERGRVMLMAKSHDELVPAEAKWETEKWYGTQYHVQKLGDAIIKKAKEPNTNPELFFPIPNPFIPTNLEVRQTETPEPAKRPRLIRETPLCSLWHKTDDQFWLPKAQVILLIRSPLAYATPRHEVLSGLLTYLIEDSLSEITYDAQLTGLGYSVGSYKEGLLVVLSGFSDKLPVLMRTVMNKVKSLVVDPQRLEVMKEQLTLGYKNFPMGQPSGLAAYKLAHLLSYVNWTPSEGLEVLDIGITEDDIRQHQIDLLSRIHIDSLVNGTFETQQALSLVMMTEELLAAEPLTPSERLSDRSLILPEGANFVKQETVTDPEEPNSSLAYYCHFGDIADSRLRAISDLLDQIIQEPCFSQLRTTEQLGYIVSSGLRSTTASMGLSFNIQSLRDPVYLEERLELFLENFQHTLEKLSDDELEVQKQGLIVNKLERLNNLSEESGLFWYHICSGYYDFVRHETDAATIRDLTLQEIVDAYNAFLHPKSPSRRKLSVHMRSRNLESPCPPAEGAVLIEDEALFKAGLTVSPAAVPVEAVPAPKPICLPV